MNVFLCVGREFLIGLAFHSLVAVNNAVLEICEVLLSGIIYSNCT